MQSDFSRACYLISRLLDHLAMGTQPPTATVTACKELMMISKEQKNKSHLLLQSIQRYERVEKE